MAHRTKGKNQSNVRPGMDEALTPEPIFDLTIERAMEIKVGRRVFEITRRVLGSANST